MELEASKREASRSLALSPRTCVSSRSEYVLDKPRIVHFDKKKSWQAGGKPPMMTAVLQPKS
jgi:hypothetical protein